MLKEHSKLYEFKNVFQVLEGRGKLFSRSSPEVSSASPASLLFRKEVIVCQSL